MKADAYQFQGKDFLVGFQMLLIAFGALVLVPLLTGLDPNVALFTAGAGTLLFQGVTRGKVPIFLASSFAFIGPILYGIQSWGIPGTLSGLVAAGGFYLGLAALVRWRGVAVLQRVLPPIVTGPVIMLIGLMLAPVAVNLAMGKSGDGNSILVASDLALGISMVTLFITVIVSLFGRGRVRLIPVLFGMIVGYGISAFLGMVNFETIVAAPWFHIPKFVFPEWNTQAILFMVPVAIAPAIEHFGDIVAIGSVTGSNYVKDPGIHRTLLGDGLATMLASFLGGPPNTTYSEVTGGVALTKMYNPAIMTWAALAAIVLAFVGKLGALLQSIPTPVVGGILVVLFGAITVVGLNTLVRSQEDLMQPRNLIIIGIILVFGIGGMTLSAGGMTLKGVGLAGILGVLLNLVLPTPFADSK